MNNIRRPLAVISAAAALMGCTPEAGPLPTPTPIEASEDPTGLPDAPEYDLSYSTINDPDLDAEIIVIQETEDGPKDSITEADRREQYLAASALIEKSTLGHNVVNMATPKVAVLEAGIGEKLCELAGIEDRHERETKWNSYAENIRNRARLTAGSGPGLELPIYEWNIGKVCLDNDKNPGDGATTVNGTGQKGGRVDIYGKLNEDTIAHEVGHYYGLGHAYALNCRREPGPAMTARPSVSDCDPLEYGDSTSVMGDSYSDVDIFNGYQMAQLGAISDSQILHAEVSGTYEIDSLLSDSDKPKLVRIPSEYSVLPMLVDRAHDRDTGYLPDQEYYYLEVSSSHTEFELPEGCADFMEPEYESSDKCNQRDVSVKAYIAGDHRSSRNPSPISLSMDLDPSGTRVGAEEDRVGEKIYDYDNVVVTLKSITANPENNGTGSAELRIDINND